MFHGQTLETVSSSKYLGLTIQRNLRLDRHIKRTCAKANKMLEFLRRNLKIGSWKVKERAYNYKAMIRPILGYAFSVWDPQTKKSISKIKMAQHRAARVTLNRHYNTAGVEEILEILEWPTLQQCRHAARLTMLYKITAWHA